MRILRASVPRWACAVVLLWGCSDAAAPPEPSTPRPVRWQTVEPTSAVRPETYAGVARAGVEARLSFRVSGTVSQVAVALGDTVRRGDLLLRLDPTDYELQVDQSKASVAQAEASLRRSEADYDRVRALYETDNASKADLDAARAAAESSRAQVRAAEKSLDQARRQVGYTVLEAPVDGSIAALEVERNENVQPGQMTILLTSAGRPEVQVSLPEILVTEVRRGLATTVRFDALPERTFEGTVTEIAAASVGGSTFEVVVELQEDAPGVRPGMAADVTFRLRGTKERLVVPQLAVGEDSRGRFVFVVEATSDAEEAVVRRRAVEVGEIQGAGLEILGGLEPGSKVVTAGVRRLSDGMRVRLLDAWGGEGP